MIYVDEIRTYDYCTIRWGKTWSHMWTDGSDLEELHAFAEKIGLKREYFQNKPRFPHYDVIPRTRRKALKNGATFKL